MHPFKALRIRQHENKVSAAFETMQLDDLTAGEVVIKVSWSCINYKDALAATGSAKIVRQFPLNGGIDLAGKVHRSTDTRFQEGDSVLVVGGGISETLDGGYAEYARVPAACVVPVPHGLSEREAMAIGTAGFTAALAVIRLERMGQTPQHGPMIVTGATGGVGSFAVDLLSSRGYEVVAYTGKTEHHDYLSALGASRFVDRNSLAMGKRPLETALWGGAVDNVGGETLAWLTRTIKPFGSIASIGLTGGFELATTVMPFILRGVSLIGINIEAPREMRDEAWQRLGADLKPQHLDKIIQREINFDGLLTAFPDYLQNKIVGRTVVKIA
ncbi:acryloyl-CoA reductase [uncultured Thiothrix sp.]|uniref:acrylyl-CoA reductase family protein n=1 Tax=uncultured Thiothrix sp. TaxID=223185 RepID=UPI002628C430|nr:acryloyl-CoA reductase [uncultured Thiothrix sp.]